MALSIVEALLKAGTNINARDEYGNSPLHEAVNFVAPSHAIIEALIESGANPGAQNYDGAIPLDLAEKWERHGLWEGYELRGTEAYWLLNEGRFE